MKSIKLLGLVFLLATCTSRTEYISIPTIYIEGKFKESGYSDYRTFEFKKDGTFKFDNEVGWPKKSTTGRYAVSDSIILLNPDSDIELDREFNQKLKIINSECIRDYGNTFYCTNSVTGDTLTNLEYKFQEEIVSILDTLREVKEERENLGLANEKYLKNAPNQIMVSDIAVDYQGIVVIDRRELHLFAYVKTDPNYHNPRQHFLSLLIHKYPFEIYRLYDFKDPPRLIYKERR